MVQKQIQHRCKMGEKVNTKKEVLKTHRFAKLDVYIFVILGLLFVNSRLLLVKAGILFDDSPLQWFWQYLDTELLKTRLLESCFYLHSQPPSFNLFLGFVLKLSASHSRILFQIIYSIFGMVLYLSIYRLCLKLGTSRILAIITSTVFIMSPDAILHENWLFYTYPVASLLTVASLFLFAYFSSKKKIYGFLFFSIIGLICTIRSSFHLIFYVFIVGMVILLDRSRGKTTAALAAFPFIIIVFLYVKSLILFGFFGTSSWAGMNYWGITGNYVSAQEHQQLVSSGKISSVSSIKPFSALESYPSQFYEINPKYDNIPALSQQYKSNTRINFNHHAYVDLSKQYMKDSWHIVRHMPQKYLQGIFMAWVVYSQPARNSWFFQYNRKHLSSLIKMYDALNLSWLDIEPLYLFLFGNNLGENESKTFRLFGSRLHDRTPVYHSLFGPDLRVRVPLSLALGLPLLLIFGLVSTLRQGNSRENRSLPQKATLFFICFTVFYVAVVGNFFELTENNRFRFVTDPFYLVLLSLALKKVINFMIRLYKKQ